MIDTTIAFIGGGNMTRAIAGGLMAGGAPAGRLLIAEPDKNTQQALKDLLPGATIGPDNAAIAANADTVVLAVKPQILAEVCRGLAATIQSRRPLIVSIAAGVRADDIDAWLGGGLAVVRVMPNQPALLGLGVSGLFANARVDDAERARAADIMAAIGRVVHVATEQQIDAVTAVSGSGPAYFFLLIDVLQATAEQLGIDSNAARTLAVETARGAAELAASADVTMCELIARVRSPGGTTAAALDHLDAADVRAILAAAITAARDRAIALADAAHNQT